MKIHFANFWGGFDPHNNFFTKHIFDEKEIIITNNNPDLVIYSVFGGENISSQYPRAKKVFYTGENIRAYDYPDLNLTFDYSTDKNIRLPLYVLTYYEASKEQQQSLFLPKMNEYSDRNQFCAFIYGNGNQDFPGVKDRIELFHQLSEHKTIASVGTHLNNLGYNVPQGKKIEYLKQFKFCFAMENQYYSGYATEKIIEPMLAGCIPIYAGSDRIKEEFNADSFIVVTDYKRKHLIDYLIELDNNIDLYEKLYRNRFCSRPELFNIQPVKDAIQQLFL